MISAMDHLLTHWADQHQRRARRPQTMLAQAMEFGGIPPRGSGASGSKDPLGLGELDSVAWEVEQALKRLRPLDQQMADEHYRDGGYSDAKCSRLQISRSSYYERLDRLHKRLQKALEAVPERRRAGA